MLGDQGRPPGPWQHNICIVIWLCGALAGEATGCRRLNIAPTGRAKGRPCGLVEFCLWSPTLSSAVSVFSRAHPLRQVVTHHSEMSMSEFTLSEVAELGVDW